MRKIGGLAEGRDKTAIKLTKRKKARSVGLKIRLGKELNELGGRGKKEEKRKEPYLQAS